MHTRVRIWNCMRLVSRLTFWIWSVKENTENMPKENLRQYYSLIEFTKIRLTYFLPDIQCRWLLKSPSPLYSILILSSILFKQHLIIIFHKQIDLILSISPILSYIPSLSSFASPPQKCSTFSYLFLLQVPHPKTFTTSLISFRVFLIVYEPFLKLQIQLCRTLLRVNERIKW